MQINDVGSILADLPAAGESTDLPGRTGRRRVVRRQTRDPLHAQKRPRRKASPKPEKAPANGLTPRQRVLFSIGADLIRATVPGNMQGTMFAHWCAQDFDTNEHAYGIAALVKTSDRYAATYNMPRAGRSTIAARNQELDFVSVRHREEVGISEKDQRRRRITPTNHYTLHVDQMLKTLHEADPEHVMPVWDRMLRSLEGDHDHLIWTPNWTSNWTSNWRYSSTSITSPTGVPSPTGTPSRAAAPPDEVGEFAKDFAQGAWAQLDPLVFAQQIHSVAQDMDIPASRVMRAVEYWQKHSLPGLSNGTGGRPKVRPGFLIAKLPEIVAAHEKVLQQEETPFRAEIRKAIPLAARIWGDLEKDVRSRFLPGPDDDGLRMLKNFVGYVNAGMDEFFDLPDDHPHAGLYDQYAEMLRELEALVDPVAA